MYGTHLTILWGGAGRLLIQTSSKPLGLKRSYNPFLRDSYESRVYMKSVDVHVGGWGGFVICLITFQHVIC